MARSEITGRKTTGNGDADDADAFSVTEFCRRHRMSVQLFYKLRDAMPRTYRVGKRVFISREAAASWRREREHADTGA